MKTSLPISLASTIAAGLLAVTAHAQTGRGSEAPSDCPTIVVQDNDEVGSYARYLMLNGVPRDEAVKAARNIDHPAASTHFALRGAPPKAGAASKPAGPGDSVASQ